uniref:SpoU_methylase domain-containing protein n=1 Tax=Brugia timori TaxID=42155 RepID=A0A0R3R4X4_9BILA
LEKLELFCIKCLKEPVQQPSIRLLVSWILVRLYCNNEDAFQKFIGIEKEAAFTQCFTLFHPWCTAQNFTVRCTSLAALKLLWNIVGNKLRDQFHYLRCIIEFDAEKAGYFDECHSFVCMLSGNFPEKKFKRKLLLFCQTQVQRHQQIREPDGLSDISVIQRKFNAVSVNRALLEGVSLIVVASLLDKAANLGGICRTCEVLGVEKLIVADLAKIKDRDFMALSMSSENWMNLEEHVLLNTVSLLPNLLLSFRNSGYVIIGAEQTTNSTPLHKIRFPSKMVLLLGNEK